MKLRGFTLIELMVVIGIVANLAVLVLLAINPGKQFAQARNTRRIGDLRTLYDALRQYSASNGGTAPSVITTSTKYIGTGAGNINLATLLSPTYLAAIPKDPVNGTDATTQYLVCKDTNDEVGVGALNSELNTIIRFGKCIQLALAFKIPSKSYVRVPASSSLNNLPAVTVDAWIYPKSDGEGGASIIVAKQDDNGGSAGWAFAISSGSQDNALVFTGNTTARNVSRGTGANAITYNTWQHVAATWDHSITGSHIHIYVNGVEKTYNNTSNGNGSAGNDSAQPLLIGNNPSFVNTFDGYIDEVRVSRSIRYSGSFTPTRLFTPDSNTAALWHFEEGSGSTAIDSSGNGNTGTLMNGTSWTITP